MGNSTNLNLEYKHGCLIGKTFNGRWRLIGLIKHEEISTIYAGFDLYTKSDVAVKTLPNAFQGDSIDREITSYKRVHLGSAQLEKKSIPLLFDYGTNQGHKFIVLQLLSWSIADIWKKCNRSLSPEAVLSIGDQALGALQCLSSKGVVHGNVSADHLVLGLKPNENIVYLIDYGRSIFLSSETQEYKNNGCSPKLDALRLCTVLLSLLVGSYKSSYFHKRNEQKFDEGTLMFEVRSLLRKVDGKLVSAFDGYLKHCEQLQSHSLPNYGLLRSTMRQLYWRQSMENGCLSSWLAGNKRTVLLPEAIRTYVSLAYSTRIRPTIKRIQIRLLRRQGIEDIDEASTQSIGDIHR